LKKISKFNDYDDPKFKKKHSRDEKVRLGNRKKMNRKIDRDDEDDFDEHEHSGIGMTTNLPTTQDLNDTTIIFDQDQEMEVVAAEN
jgi:hypothetical protein